MKTIVVNKRENEKVPFLRGILVRSLLDAGLTYKLADKISNAIRDQLVATNNISSQELKKRVVAMLENEISKEILEQYRYPSVVPETILVNNLNGNLRAFSRARLARSFQSSGMKAEKSEAITERIYSHLIAAGINSLETYELAYLSYLCLRQEVGKRSAKRYLVWSEFQRGNKPLIVMIGGTVGAGKSTIATEIGHLLDIVRIQSTDMLREVMRMMLPERMMPVLHTSSFNAWKTLPTQDCSDRDSDQRVIEGFQNQVELLTVPSEAVLQRAVEESVPIILEGVHALPELLDRVPGHEKVIKVYVMLAVLKSKKLKAHLRGRGVQVPERRAKRYLESFESIWSLQSFLLSEADRCNVPIITAADKKTVVVQVIQQVNQELAKHFNGSPAEVFGAVVEIGRSGKCLPDWRKLIRLLKK